MGFNLAFKGLNHTWEWGEDGGMITLARSTTKHTAPASFQINPYSPVMQPDTIYLQVKQCH